jgi:NAD(P)-dependent dehydrogenase (short-subunit alcohol dehydrogenase family)
MGRLSGKVAIVTGSGRGIGRGIATLFAGEGAAVVVASRTAAAVDAVVGELQALGGRALGVPCDVGRKEQVDAVTAAAVAQFGAIDILVNVAQGFGTREEPTPFPQPRALEAVSDAEWDFTLSTGLMGTLWCMRAVFPYMKDRGGKIINFGSLAGQRGSAGTAAYNVTKEAIRALTRTAAREWGRYRINVNVINPAARSRALDEYQQKNPPKTDPAAQVPLGRLGDALADIAPAALFLASSDSDYITGMTLMVDGGLLILP